MFLLFFHLPMYNELFMSLMVGSQDFDYKHILFDDVEPDWFATLSRIYLRVVYGVGSDRKL